MRTSSIQCHSNTVLVPPHRPPDPLNDFYDGQTYDMKTRVGICTKVDMVPVENGQTYDLKKRVYT